MSRLPTLVSVLVCSAAHAGPDAGATQTCSVLVEHRAEPLVARVVARTVEAAAAVARAEVCAKLKAARGLDCDDATGARVWRARTSTSVTITNGVERSEATVEMHAAKVEPGKGTAAAATRELACQAAHQLACRQLGVTCPSKRVVVTEIDGLPIPRREHLGLFGEGSKK